MSVWPKTFKNDEFLMIYFFILFYFLGGGVGVGVSLWFPTIIYGAPIRAAYPRTESEPVAAGGIKLDPGLERASWND